jgi:hypothetical protein
VNVNACEDIQDRLLDFVEDELEPGTAALVRSHLESCPACREYHAWLVGTGTELKTFGDILANAAPPIDIVGAVMRSVEGAERAPAVLSFPKRRPNVNWRFAAGLAGLAAAAGLTLLAWLEWDGLSKGAHTAPGPIVASSHGLAKKPTPQALKKLESSRAMLAKLDPVGRPHAPKPKAMETTTPPDVHAISVDDVVRARRKAVGDEEARAQLVRWASLTPDAARKLLQRSDISASTTVAVAESLGPEEASTVLLTAVGRHPDNSLLRFQTASTLLEKSRVADAAAAKAQQDAAGTGEDAPPVVINPLSRQTAIEGPTRQLTLDQIQVWQNLDPNNALPYYLQADVLLRGGDLPAALDALRQAQQIGTVNVYGLESAQARQEALAAGGMAPDTARLLAALTAGNNEYNFLYTLTNDLLDYGRAYADQNSLSEAQQIYESVARLGEQVASGANLTLVESAGLNAQQQALTGLQDVYAALGSEEAITRFQNQTMELLLQIDELNRYMTELNTLFTSPDAIWNAVADAILQVGDLNLFSSLNQAGG